MELKTERFTSTISNWSLEKQDLDETLDISRTTLWTWEKDQEFKAEVGRIKQNTENFAMIHYYNNLIKAVKNVQ